MPFLNENCSDPENVIQSKYDIDELQKLKIPKRRTLYSNSTSTHNNFNFQHINFKELQNLLQSTNINFDVIAITETRISKNVSVTQIIVLNNYSFEHTPTESSAGGTLLYIANYLSYKILNDLKIYKKIELESTFIEIVNPRKSNIIAGVIYKHLKMDGTDFNNNFLKNFLKKINQEQKKVFLLGDFNVELIHYNEHKPTNEFLDSLASNSYLPYITQPSRYTNHSRTLIDNIFSNLISKDIICGNITATISDHLPLFLVSMNTFANPPSNKFNVFERDWSKFDQENILDYFDIDWSNLLKLNEKNVDLSTNIFLNDINSLLNKYALFKKISKYKLKFKTRPWITFGIQISISVKNKLLKKFINKKDLQIKAVCHEKYKKYRNILSTLLKESKQIYYTKYFESNWNNIKNTWKGIKL